MQADPTALAAHAPPSAGDRAPSNARDAAVARLLWPVWIPAIGMLAAALIEARRVGIGLRDPGGQLFALRMLEAIALFAACILIDGIARSRRTPAEGGVRTVIRARWSRRRVALVLSGLLAYHVAYVAYRNLKSWTALHPARDVALLHADRSLLGGHDPAVLLHHALGSGAAAVILATAYRSFGILVPFTFVAALTFSTRLRDGFTFLTAAIWVWVIGTISYYSVVSTGPFMIEPHVFEHLHRTVVNTMQSHYVEQRAAFVRHPHDGSTYNSLSAFASLHVAYTTTFLMFVHWMRWRRLTIALSAFLALTLLATVYFGWHYLVDDIAGLALAAAALAIALVTVRPVPRSAR